MTKEDHMRALAIGAAVTAILFLLTGGRLIFIPLLFVPLGLIELRRLRRRLPSIRGRPLVRRQ